MKVIESIRYNRTGEVNEAVIFESDHGSNADALTAAVLVTQALSARNDETARNLFTTTAIRIEF